MNKQQKYTAEARKVLMLAREEALRLRHRMVGTEHLLLGILKLNDAAIERLFAAFHASSLHIGQAIEFVIGRGAKAYVGDPTLTQASRNVLARAEQEAIAVQAPLIDVEHLLLAILGERDGIPVGVMASFGVHGEDVRKYITRRNSPSHGEVITTENYQARYDATPTLNQVSRDLTAAALLDTLDPMIGREEELERTMQILSRRSKNNPVLLGPAGVGKTAIAEGLAQRIILGQVPDTLRNRRVVALDVAMLTVGTKFRGDYEERLKRIMQEILADKGIIIVIDELHTLMSSGVAEGSIDAANLFKPMLARGEFQCIGATTLNEYRKTVEEDPALERRFQPVQVREPNAAQTLDILRGLRSRYEEFHGVTISDEALHAAIKLSSRYIQGRYQPDKSLDLLDEAASRANVARTVAPDAVRQMRAELDLTVYQKEYAIAKRDFPIAAGLRKRELYLLQMLSTLEYAWQIDQQEQRPVLREQQIAEIVAQWTGIPAIQVAAEEAQRLLTLEDELHKRIIGQHEAVQAVAKALRRSRTNLRDSRRPIGSFLFVGPTGVGKTELARALADTLFSDEKALLKLDMSEFMEPQSVSRLIGSPPGYVGYGEGGQLTESVRRRPYSVVLLDEIEKAHPKVFDLLLQILGDGCLTDAQGQSVDFRNTLVILTSNAGTAHLATRGEPSFFTSRRSREAQRADVHEGMKGVVSSELKQLFKPELLNRIDDIILFHTLEAHHLHQIVELLITQTQHRLEEQGIMLHVSDEARELLVMNGYDVTYGARPLRRAVQRLLDDMLAEAILQGTLHSGDTAIVDVVDGALRVSRGAVVLTEVAA